MDYLNQIYFSKYLEKNFKYEKKIKTFLNIQTSNTLKSKKL